MSLLRYGSDLASAVAGELDAAAEARLRAHLAGCTECRAHYDALTLAARALSGKAEATAEEARRAEARLLSTLAGPAASAPARPDWRWAWGLAVPALAMALLVVVARPSEVPGDVTLRGGGAEADAGRFTARLYAKPKAGGALALVAEFPGSGEATVRADAWLQFVLGPNQRGTRIVAVDAEGAPHWLSQDSSASLPGGSYRLWVLHDLSMTEAEALEEAKAPWPSDALPVPLSTRADQLGGVLQVQP